MDNIMIEYYGHSCFRLTIGDQRIVLDPYSDGTVPGYPPLRLDAEFLFCSHEHPDHYGKKCVSIPKGGKPSFEVVELLTDHDDRRGKDRGKNTIRVFSFGGIRVAHFGDLGRMLTEEEIEKLGKLDCIMIPVGGFFTIDASMAAQIVDRLQPSMVIPMHYRLGERGYEVLAELEDVRKAFRQGLHFCEMDYGEKIMIEKSFIREE